MKFQLTSHRLRIALTVIILAGQLLMPAPALAAAQPVFTASSGLPSQPPLMAPASGLTTNQTTPMFSWQPVVYGHHYQLQVSNSSSFTAFELDVILETNIFSYTPAAALAGGLHYWRVRGYTPANQPGVWSSARYFKIDVTPPSAPGLYLPLNAATSTGTPTFNWKAAATAVRYQYQCALDADFAIGIYTSKETSLLSHKPPLQQPGLLYWHVRARDTAGNWSAWSNTRSTTIRPTIPTAPALLSPANFSYTSVHTPVLSWKAVAYGTQYNLQIHRSSTFTSPVLFEINTGPATSTVLPDLGTGKFYWRVRAKNSEGNAGSWSSTWAYTIDLDAPAAPTLASPADGSTAAGTPAYTWKAAAGAYRYVLQIADGADFSNLTYASGELTVLTAKPPLQAPGVYYWRVRARDRAGNWSESAARSVTVAPGTPPAPALLAPPSGSYTNNPTPQLSWKAATYGDQYQLQVSRSSTFSPSLLLQRLDSGVLEYTFGQPLTAAKYYWRVRAYNNAGKVGSWSITRSFTVDVTPPKAPALYSPANNYTKSGTPTYQWLTSTSASRYRLEISTDLGFSSLWYTSPETASLSLKPPLQDPGEYYWRVSARDASGNWSVPSAARKVTIVAPIPAAPTAIYPSDQASVMTYPIDLSWTTVPYGKFYEVELSTNSTFTAVIRRVKDASTTLHNTYLPSGYYYWRARAINASSQTGPWSKTYKFAVKAYDTEVPVNPSVLESTTHSANTYSSDPTVTVAWSPDASDGSGSGVAGYSVFWFGWYEIIPDTSVDLPADVYSQSQELTNGNWYFMLRTCDVDRNCADSKYIGPFYIDTTPPMAVEDLSAVAIAQGSYYLTWKVPNDQWYGQIGGYQVRTSQSPIESQAAWDSAEPVTSGVPLPKAVGENEQMLVSGLAPDTTQYFAVRVVDRAGNLSGLSNSPAVDPPTAPTVVTDMAGLAAAIQQANSNPDFSRIELMGGTYTLTSGDVSDPSNAFPVINSPVAINGQGAVLTRDSAAPAFRFFKITANGSLALENLTLSGGLTSDGAEDSGGAIYNTSQPLWISNCTFSNNSTGIHSSTDNTGGAIFSQSGLISISHSTFSGNSAARWGGAIYTNYGPSSITISDSVFSSNFASVGSVLHSYQSGSVSIFGSTFFGNQSSLPMIEANRVEVYDSFLHDNQTSNLPVIRGAELIFENSVLYKNIGGGLQAGGGSQSRITNSCILANSSDDGTPVVQGGQFGLAAVNNYWGQADGPSGAGPGSGDSINNSVVYAPFATAPLPGCPSEAVVADIAAQADASTISMDVYWGYYTIPNQVVHLSAKVFGANGFERGVTWSIISGGGALSTPLGAEVDLTTPATTGTIVVRAASVVNPAISKEVTIRVSALEISNQYATKYKVLQVNNHTPLTVNFKVDGSSIYQPLSELTWTVIEGEGSLGWDRLPEYLYDRADYYLTYYAPAMPGSAVVRISTKLDPSKYVDIPITIVESGPVNCSNIHWSQGPISISVSMSGLVENDPVFGIIKVSEYDPFIGQTITVTMDAGVKGGNPEYPITRATFTYTTDNKSSTYDMTLVSGSAVNGTWSVTIPVDDTHCINNEYHFSVENAQAKKWF